MLFDKVSPVMNEQHQLGEPVGFRELHLVFQQWTPCDRDHWLRQITQPIAKPRPSAACKNDTLPAHELAISRTTSSTARAPAWFDVSRGDHPSCFSFWME